MHFQTNSVNLAIQLNDEGVALMSQDKFSVAISRFQQALNSIREELQGRYRSDHQSEGDALLFYFAPGPTVSAEHTKDSNTTLPHLEQQEQAFVFQRPMVVAAITSGEMDCESLAPIVKFSFVLLYNLALTMHLSALASKKGSVTVRRLKKSIIFYELAYSMMRDEEIRGVTETMAIMNNIGRIHHVLGDDHKAHQCYHNLFSILVFVTDCDERDAVQDFDAFFQGVLPAVLPQAPVAQAA